MFLKVLSDLMVITSPLTLMVMLGLAMPATFLVAKPTPAGGEEKRFTASPASLRKSCGVATGLCTPESVGARVHEGKGEFLGRLVQAAAAEK